MRYSLGGRDYGIRPTYGSGAGANNVTVQVLLLEQQHLHGDVARNLSVSRGTPGAGPGQVTRAAAATEAARVTVPGYGELAGDADLAGALVQRSVNRVSV
jgi:hypothetical protein